MRSLSLRPGNSLTTPRVALSIGFTSFGFPPACYPSYGALTLAPVGLNPTENASLRWAHQCAICKEFRASTRSPVLGASQPPRLYQKPDVPHWAPTCRHEKPRPSFRARGYNRFARFELWGTLAFMERSKDFLRRLANRPSPFRQLFGAALTFVSAFLRTKTSMGFELVALKCPLDAG